MKAAGAGLTLTPEKIAELSQGALAPPTIRIATSDPYYIMFTSGSTGEPKGVVITLGCLTSFVDWMLGEQPFEEGEVFLNVVPYSFDVSLMDTALGLVTGGTVYSVTKEDVANPKQLYKTLGASNVTTWVSTPSFAQMCLVERSFGSRDASENSPISLLRRDVGARSCRPASRALPQGASLEHLRSDRGDSRHNVNPHRSRNSVALFTLADRLPDAGLEDAGRR